MPVKAIRGMSQAPRPSPLWILCLSCQLRLVYFGGYPRYDSNNDPLHTPSRLKCGNKHDSLTRNQGALWTSIEPPDSISLVEFDSSDAKHKVSANIIIISKKKHVGPTLWCHLPRGWDRNWSARLDSASEGICTEAHPGHASQFCARGWLHVECTTTHSLAFPWADWRAAMELNVRQTDAGERRVWNALDQPSLLDVLPLNILYHQAVHDWERIVVVALIRMSSNITSNPQTITDIVQDHVGDSDVSNEPSPAGVGLDVNTKPWAVEI